MQKDNEKNERYKLNYLITQAVICIILLLAFLVMRLFGLPQSKTAQEWYKENFMQQTKVDTVIDTQSQKENTSSFEQDGNAIETSFDLSKAYRILPTKSQTLNSIVWPVSNGKITSDFGYRSDPFTANNALHKGIDIAVNMGTPVAAAADGKVIKSGYERWGYGNFVMIEHSSGFVTLYAHCSKIVATVGSTVKAGQTVALSGSTGKSTGPHLHFEVRLHNTLLNPLWILPINDEI